MDYLTIREYLLREDQNPILKLFFISSNCVFDNFANILNCIRAYRTKTLPCQHNDLLKKYYLGCTELRKANIDITNAPLCMWALAEQILDYYKAQDKSFDANTFIIKKQMKEIRNFYYRAIAKTTDEYRKIDPHEFYKNNW